MFGIVHVHSMFSLHDSAQSPEELVLRAKEIGVQNVTLTDHGSMLGLDDFMEAGDKYGINTIPGVEMYLENREHFLLIARDYEGYRQIAEALKEANRYQIKKNRIVFPCLPYGSLKDIFAGSTHVIATTACIAGPIGKILLEGKRAEERILVLQEKIGKLKNDYEEWEVANAEYLACLDLEKKRKAERKEYTSYTRKSYLKQAESDSRKKKKYDSAVSMIEKLDKELAAIKDNRRSSKKTADKLKSRAQKYAKLSDELQLITIPREQELYERAKSLVCEYKEIFPYFFLELQNHGLEEERFVMQKLCRISSETGVPVIAGNDAHMARPGDEKARQILRYNYFSKHQEITDADKKLYVYKEREMYDALAEIVEHGYAALAVQNTEILDDCHVILPSEPHYPKALSEHTFEELIDEGIQRMKARHEWTAEHEARLSHEIRVIKDMGYVEYHMIVWDYCRMIRMLSVIPEKELPYMPRDFSKVETWIQKKGFRSGYIQTPGRGSAAGSLVCYLLQITNVDPIKYGLLFDRYLNPERVSMPDIDTDVKRCLRPYIIRYLKWKYGENAVCSIMTQNMYGARSAVLMAGRDRASELYGGLKNHENLEQKYLHSNTLKITALLGEDQNVSLKDYQEKFYSQYGADTEKCAIWERAKLIEGKLAGTGIHAGGVVIADNGDVGAYVPLGWQENKKVWAAQCDMVHLEKKGLLKMDLLGLKTQDCNSEALQLIEQHHGISVDLDEIKSERKVFESIFWTGRTNSVFQFESDGMKNMLKRFKPECIEDLILLVAMYRPGPMQFIDDIIEVKSGKKKAEYETDKLIPILSKTYGAIVYQEQVMQIFQSLAGYTLGQADLVRKAMSKKDSDKLAQERNAFIYGDAERKIDGCIKCGIAKEAAEKIFDEMTEFAKYAFNKSHAAAYAIISYQMAWLKYHYPAETYCAVMNHEEELAPLFEDCRFDGIRILPPDINHSYYEFTIEKGAIRYGMRGIKGIGERTYPDFITDNRAGNRKNQPYLSIADFFQRMSNASGIIVPKRMIVPLIQTGAFDRFAPDRKWLLEACKRLYDTKIDNLNSYFALFEHTFKDIPGQCDRRWNMEQENHLLGAFLSDDPFENYKDEQAYGCTPIESLTGGKHKIMGYLESEERKESKSGKLMYLLHIVGKKKSIKVIFMGSRSRREYIGNVVQVSGQFRDNTFWGKNIEVLSSQVSPYYLDLDTPEKTAFATSVMEGREDGMIPLVIIFHYNRKMEMIPPFAAEFMVTMETARRLKAIRGSGCGMQIRK